MDYGKSSLDMHKKLGGKLSISLKDTPDSKEKLSTYYTPGVAAVSSLLANNPTNARDYTWLNNCVAIISDGSAVLGLGDIGPYGALPVMEGKAMLFKHFANIDGIPIVLDVHESGEIIKAIKAIAPSFGGINLEDIAAPKCFEIEDKLKASLKIPVFHDDQHGTAIVVLAGLINSLKLAQKNLSKCKVVIVGAGSAGVAIARLLSRYAKPNIVAVDTKGVIHNKRGDLTPEKRYLASLSRGQHAGSNFRDAMTGADIFIGVSKEGMINQSDISVMNSKPIIFAMANPTPEIMPEEAAQAGAFIVATGRSDFPNQINNAVAFPGIFRGALDNKLTSITDKHKILAAETIANLVNNPTPKCVIPSVLDPRLVPAIAKVIR